MRVRGDAPHGDLCPSNDGSPGPVDCDFCERLYSADARGYTRGWSAGYEQGQRDEREAAAQRLKVVRDAADVALLGTLQTTRDRVIAAIDALEKP